MARSMRLAQNIEKQLWQSTRAASRSTTLDDEPCKVYKAGDPDLYRSDHSKAILKAVRLCGWGLVHVTCALMMVFAVACYAQICEGFFLNSAARCGASDSYRLNSPEFRCGTHRLS